MRYINLRLTLTLTLTFSVLQAYNDDDKINHERIKM